MAKKVKNTLLGARIDDDYAMEVETYIDGSHISMSDLVRAAVKEYMWAHPIKETKETI